MLDVAHLGRKEVELEHTCLDEPLYLWFRYGRNIMKAGTGKRRNLPTLDHAPVADERHPFAAQAPGHLRNLRRQGLQIGGIASKHLCRHGGACLVAQQPKNDLLLARFAVPVIAKRCQGITLAFKVTAGDVIQKQCRLTGPAPRCEQAALDGRLMVS